MRTAGMRHQGVRLENGVTVETWVPSWKVTLHEHRMAIAAIVVSVVTMAAAHACMRRCH